LILEKNYCILKNKNLNINSKIFFFHFILLKKIDTVFPYEKLEIFTMNRYMDSSIKIFVLLLFLGVFPVFADDNVEVNGVSECAECAKGTDFFEGFAVGVDAVYGHAEANHDVTDNGIIFQNGDVWKDVDLYSLPHKRSQIVPSVNVGYSCFFKNWYVGVVADILLGRNKERTDTLSKANGHFKMNGISYGVKVKSGYYFEDLNSVIYGIAGIKWQNINFEVDMNNPEIHKCKVSSTRSRLKSPLFVLGVGAERPISKRLSLSAEYEYAWRNSKGEVLTNYANGNLRVSAFAKTKQSLKEHSVKVGLKYHF